MRHFHRSRLVLAVTVLAGCGRAGTPDAPDTPAADPVAAVNARTAPAAFAELTAIDGSGVSGTVRLTDLGAPGSGTAGAGTRVTADVRGLGAGDNYHGFQILDSGSCDGLGDSPAHFNPDRSPHGPFDAPAGARHAGDLGNLRAYDGAGRYDRVDAVVALSGPRSAIGRAVVVRAGQDDGFSADGGAGDIVACGILQ